MDAIAPDEAYEAADAHTIGRKSARSSRVEVLTRADRRRSWSPEQKREIVGESLGLDLTVTEIARKHGISTGQVYTWRHQLLGIQNSLVARSGPRFASVELTTPVPAAPDPTPPPVVAASCSRSRHEGEIEILLPSGVLVRVDAHVDGRALRRVLVALDSR